MKFKFICGTFSNDYENRPEYELSFKKKGIFSKDLVFKFEKIGAYENENNKSILESQVAFLKKGEPVYMVARQSKSSEKSYFDLEDRIGNKVHLECSFPEGATLYVETILNHIY